MAVLHDIAVIVHESTRFVTAAAQYNISGKVKAVESGLAKTVLGLGFLKFLLLVLAAGIGFLLWGFYRLLASNVSSTAAALILGSIVLLTGLVICLLVVRTASKNK